MSLRRDVHNAFETITPPLGGMPERVLHSVLADKRRRRKKGMLLRFRAPMSLVAALIVMALVAAVLVGYRLIQDWNNVHQVPASYQAQVAELEARPMHLPVLHRIQDCKTGPFNRAHDFGSGPVYTFGASAAGSSWGSYGDIKAYADIDITGPILIRAQDLFTYQRLIFVGDYAAGTLIGTDTRDGTAVQQYDEVVLNTANASKTASIAAGHKYVWPFTVGVPNTTSGSWGWEIDGVGFTETFLLC